MSYSVTTLNNIENILTIFIFTKQLKQIDHHTNYLKKKTPLNSRIFVVTVFNKRSFKNNYRFTWFFSKLNFLMN